jgi:hypothetical protein
VVKWEFGYIFEVMICMKNNIVFSSLLFALLMFSSVPPLAKKERPSFKLAYKIVVPGVSCYTLDHMGNLYTANNKGDILKFDNKGKQTATTNHKSYGNIQSIDASNPFEIYVFYKEQNKMLFFDNQLNDRGLMDFEEAGYFLLSAASRSFDNKVWVFDLNDLRLKKIRKDLSLELSSGNVREFAISNRFDPEYIGDVNKQLYLFNKTTGLYEFDIFGNFTRKITLTDASQVQVSHGNLYYLKNNNIIGLDPTLLRDSPLTIQDKPENVKSFSISPNRVVLQTIGDTLCVFEPI